MTGDRARLELRPFLLLGAAFVVACQRSGNGTPAAPASPVVHPPSVRVAVAVDTTVVGDRYAPRLGSFIGPIFLGSSPAHWERDVGFVVHRDGSVRPEPATPGDALAERVGRTLGRIGANATLALPASAPDSVEVSARITSDPVEPPLRYATASGDSARYPLDVDDVASPRPRENRPPMYPIDEQVNDRPGQAVAECVVLANGNVDRSTIRIIESTSPAFAAAVAKSVPPLRFAPAQLGGRPVPQVVELPMFFYTRSEDAPQNTPPNSFIIRGFKTTVRMPF